MNANLVNSVQSISEGNALNQDEIGTTEKFSIRQFLLDELRSHLGDTSGSIQRVATRLADEVQRVCYKSDRIQTSGNILGWQMSLARHRLKKCLSYYQLGSKRGRVELHSHLSVIVYRHIAPSRSHLGFSARYNLIEDFLQDFYTESLKAFRRENEVAEDYQPRTKLELAEYMAFTEQYAKRRITLPNGYNQQLVILRAQTFARRQPKETSVDIDQAGEFSNEEEQGKTQSAMMQQVRSQILSDTNDPSESVLRDRVTNTLFQYLESQGQTDCANYLSLKLQDLSASEIDEILGLTPRQRDYLQQRFKYHVEKFSRSSHWKLVHQWLGADIDQKLGLTQTQWEHFVAQLSPQQQQLLSGKQEKRSDSEIAQAIGLTPKKLQKQWTEILEIAAKIRNQS